MLISATFQNVLSFDEPATFSMTPGKITKQHLNHVVRVGGLSVLRGALVYGPNAAGKSNFIRALGMLSSMLAYDSCRVVAGRQYRLSPDRNPVSSWDVVYSYGDFVYRYIVRTNGLQVIEETLLALEEEGETLLFSRKLLDVVFGESFREDPWFKSRTFRRNGFLLAKLLQDGIADREDEIKEARRIVGASRGVMSLKVVFPGSQPRAQALGPLLNIGEFKAFLRHLMEMADVGISDIAWRPCSRREASAVLARNEREAGSCEDGVRFVMDQGSLWFLSTDNGRTRVYELSFVHNGTPMRLLEESEGTIRLFQLSVFLFSLRSAEIVWLVDEIDCHLHPFVTYRMLDEFLGMEGSRSQIIATAHDTSLMTNDLWRSDEIWFVEKRADGSSDMYSLYQYTPRFDKSLERGYRKGLYGAIPHIGGEMLNGRA